VKLAPEPPPASVERLPTPKPVSFGHVPLPTELELSTNKNERGWRCTFDPLLNKTGSKGKDVIRRYREDNDHLTKRIDPRLSFPDKGRSTTYGRKIARNQLERVKFDVSLRRRNDTMPSQVASYTKAAPHSPSLIFSGIRTLLGLVHRLHLEVSWSLELRL